MATLTLYQFATCPFCAKVRAKLEDLNLDYQKVNVAPSRDDEQRKFLFEKSGVATVPVLKVTQDDGSEKYIGESGDIIAYLEKNFS